MTVSVHDRPLDALTARVCVIVVTHDRPGLLTQCLDALQSQTIAVQHLLVVDNASQQETSDFLSGRPQIKTARLDENSGGAGGFAHGLAIARERGFDWAWLMDDDALPEHRAFEMLLRVMTTVPDDVVGLHSTLVERLGTTLQLYQEPFEVPKATFVGLAVRLSGVERVGLPRDDFFIYTDDTEYCLRLRRGNHRILSVPGSEIQHADWLRNPTNLNFNLFGRRIVVYPEVAGWRKYYLARNRILTGYTHGWWRLALGIVQSVGFLALTVVIRPRDTELVARGLADGLRQRSGKRVAPP